MLLHKTCMKCNHANPGTALPAGRRKGYERYIAGLSAADAK